MLSAHPPCRNLYEVMERHRRQNPPEGTGCGGGSGYGELELTVLVIYWMMNFIKENAPLALSSAILDIGAGTRKPKQHAAQDPECNMSVGVQIEDVGWECGSACHRRLFTDMNSADARKPDKRVPRSRRHPASIKLRFIQSCVFFLQPCVFVRHGY